RYGPFVQIGTKDDEEKPRFAGLRPGQKMDAVTLADAMELFKLPRTLGETSQGETILANVGRFGPYVKYGSKYASLKEDDPYTVTLERAHEVIRLKQEADANRIIQDFPAEGIQVLNGRYGPYITDRKKNAKIPKDRDPKALTLEECRALLAAAPERGSRPRQKALDRRDAAGLIEQRRVAAVGDRQRLQAWLLALHARERLHAQDVRVRAADDEHRHPRERAPYWPQIRGGCGAALQGLADQRVGVHLRHPLRVGAVTQARDLLPARIAQVGPGGCVIGAQLRDGLGPAAHRRGLAGVAADALEPRGVDFRADVVEHDA